MNTPSPALRKSEFPQVALLWAPEAYTLGGGTLTGRRLAGAGFIRAIAAAAPRSLHCYARSLQDAQHFQHTFKSLGASDTMIHWIPFLQPQGIRETGLLYRPDANIASDAWRRAAHGGDGAYSICGVTHTTATHLIMEAIVALLTAPLQSWDALICTSHAVRDSVRSIVEATSEHLKSRIGATRLVQPQFPVIPLGVDCDAYAFRQESRVEARYELGIEPDEVVVSFVGRLSFHVKAHHVPMYLALEKAARGHRVVLLQAGWFSDESVERVFREEASQLCPSVRCLFVDGRNPDSLRKAWAATDVFTSLVDNFQETFGLTPIEAMAAGLPSVVSDWDGYKDTVRDGVDGFRVPTLTMPGGTGGDLADRYDWGIDNYDFYMFHTSQLVAVDIDAAAEAYRKLIADAGLRAEMGHAARKRARTEFDWSVIRERYVALWEELAERRRTEAAVYMPDPVRRRPDRADPFTMFSSYPTHVMGCPKMQFRRRAECTVEQAIKRRQLDSTRNATGVLPTQELIEKLVGLLPETHWATFENLRQAASEYEYLVIARAFVWLCKFGILTYRVVADDGAG
jgi:starch synthase